MCLVCCACRRGGYNSKDSHRDRYDRERGYDRQQERGHDSRDRGYSSRGGSSRGGYDSRDRDRGVRDYADRERDRERERGEYRSRSSRSRSRSRGREAGRDARDVFKDKAVADGSGAGTDIRSRYGDASGKLDLGSTGSGRRTDEVFRLGGRGYR